MAGLRLGEEEQAELQSYMVDMELKGMQQRFCQMTQYCFEHCVKDFKSRQITKKERVCLEACADKFQATWDRCMRRWQEQMVMGQMNMEQQS